MATSDSSLQQIQELDVNIIQPNPHQPRKQLDPQKLQDLADSITKHGLLEPIVVAHTPAGYQIIAGERRWRATKLAGLDKIAAIVKKTSPRGMLEMSLIENVQREDLNPLERAHALDRLISEFSMTSKELAKQISKSEAYISNSLKLLRLPDAIKDGLLSELITEGHARALAGIKDPKGLIDAYKQVLRESASVRRTEEIARRMKYYTGQDEPTKKERKVEVGPEIVRFEQTLQSSLGENAKVKLRRSLRQTEVRIKLKGSPDETQSALEKIISIAHESAD